MAFDVAFVLQSLPVLAKGAVLTLTISISAILVGLIMGLVVALARLSRFKPVSFLTGIYISFMRGTPMLMQIFLVFLVIPSLLNIELPALPAGIAAMGLNSAAFMGEMIRGGIQSMPRGQVDAARALGMNHAQTMRRIVLPQVFNKLLPAMTNEFVLLVKYSSILSAITVIELTRTGQQLVGTHFKPVEAYVSVAILYLLINLTLLSVTDRLEKRVVATR